MTVPRLVVGAPVWNRSWCLPIWFDSLLANVDPRDTGLIFVIPASDTDSRDIIADRARGFSFVEILRDKNEQFSREVRLRDNHRSLALARNAILQHVANVGPDWYLSWDSDFLVSPGVVGRLINHSYPLTGVWAWLNRKPAQQGQHWDRTVQAFVPVEWNEPFNGTAMEWAPKLRLRAAQHLDPRCWHECAKGLWPADVVLAWQLMRPFVYRTARYDAHPYGEDIPFNASVARAGIQAWCYGDEPGLHLFNRPTAEKEIRDGYPAIMARARTDLPLAATRLEPESEDLRVIGYFERQDSHLTVS